MRTLNGMEIDRNWFITVVTYGTWLPGDERGFVGYHRPDSVDHSRGDSPLKGKRVIHNVVGTPRDADVPALRRYAASIMNAQPLLLNLPQARALLEQFQETCDYRGWRLWAASIMRNHFHVVVGAAGDPDPRSILRDIKSYASRKLNRGWGPPASETWWADSGSKRKLATDESLYAAIRYTIAQDHPLIVWSHPIPELDIPGGILSQPPANRPA